ncbi:hypothetical protein FHG87_023854 [Trinorchestia longiramus]|nr:hypothetical protein FHG87_023854 [Trinorchestia longiramus]
MTGMPDSSSSSSDSLNMSDSGDLVSIKADHSQEAALEAGTSDATSTAQPPDADDTSAVARGDASEVAIKSHAAHTSGAIPKVAAKCSTASVTSASRAKAGQASKLRAPTNSGSSKTAEPKFSKLSSTGASIFKSRASKPSEKFSARSEAVSKSTNVSSFQKRAVGISKKSANENKIVSPKGSFRQETKSVSAANKFSSKNQTSTSSSTKTGITGRGPASAATAPHASTTSKTSTSSLTPPVLGPPQPTVVSRTAVIRSAGPGTDFSRGRSAETGVPMTSMPQQLRRGSGTTCVSKEEAAGSPKTPLAERHSCPTTAVKLSAGTKPAHSTGAIPKAVKRGQSAVTTTTTALKIRTGTVSLGAASRKSTAGQSSVGEIGPFVRGNKETSLNYLKDKKKLNELDQKAMGPGHYKKRLSYNAPTTKRTKSATKTSKEAPAAVGRSFDDVGEQPTPSDETSAAGEPSLGAAETVAVRGDLQDASSPTLREASPQNSELGFHEVRGFDDSAEPTQILGSSDQMPAQSTETRSEDAISQDSTEIADDDTQSAISEQLKSLEIKDTISDEVASEHDLRSIQDGKSSEKLESTECQPSPSFSAPCHSADDATKMKTFSFPLRHGLFKHGLSLSADQLRRSAKGVRGISGSMSAEPSAIPSPVFDNSESIQESPSVSIETDNSAAAAAAAATARPGSAQPTQACEFPLALDASEASSEATVGTSSQETKTDEQTPRKRINLLNFCVKDRFVPADVKAFASHKSKIPPESRLDKAMMVLLANSYRSLLQDRKRKAEEQMLKRATTQSFDSPNLPSLTQSHGDTSSRSETPQYTRPSETFKANEDHRTKLPESASEGLEEAVTEGSEAVTEGSEAVTEGSEAVTEGSEAVTEGSEATAKGGKASDSSTSDSTTGLSASASLTDDESGWSDGSVAYDVLYNFNDVRDPSLLDSRDYTTTYLNYHNLLCEALALLRCERENKELVMDALRVLGNFVETDFCYFILKYATEEELNLLKDAATHQQVKVLEDKEYVKISIANDEGLIWL